MVIMLLFTTACGKTMPTIEFKEGLVFEYGSIIDITDEEILNTMIDVEKSKYDEIKSVEINTEQVTSEGEGKLVAILNEQEKEFEFKYEVKDTQFPVISGVETVIIEQGQTPNFDNIIASDVVDGSLEVKIEGEYLIDVVGEYELTAVAVDSNSNETKEQFKLVVEAKKVSDVPSKPNQNNTKPQQPNVNGAKPQSPNNNGGGSKPQQPNNPANSGGATKPQQPQYYNRCTNQYQNTQPGRTLCPGSSPGNSGKEFKTREEAMNFGNAVISSIDEAIAWGNKLGGNIGGYNAWTVFYANGEETYTVGFEVE